MATALHRFLMRAGKSKNDLAIAAGNLRYATVHVVVEGRHVPGVEIAKKLAEGTVVLAEEVNAGRADSDRIEPVTPAEILGVADWSPSDDRDDVEAA